MAIPFLTEADFHDPEGLFYIQQSWPTAFEESLYEIELHKHYATDHSAHYFEGLEHHQTTQCLRPRIHERPIGDLPF